MTDLQSAPAEVRPRCAECDGYGYSINQDGTWTLCYGTTHNRRDR